MARSPWTLFPCKIANRVERKKGKNRINKLNQLRKISKVYTRKGNFSQKSKLLPLLTNENSGRIFTTFLRNYSATLFLFSFVQKREGFSACLESWKTFSLARGEKKRKKARCSMANNRVYATRGRWYSGRWCREQIRVTLLGFLFSDRSRSSFPSPVLELQPVSPVSIFLYFSFSSILYFIPVFRHTYAGQFSSVTMLKSGSTQNANYNRFAWDAD